MTRLGKLMCLYLAFASFTVGVLVSYAISGFLYPTEQVLGIVSSIATLYTGWRVAIYPRKP